MDNWILIRGARQLLTLHGPSGPRRGSALGELSLIADGSVLLHNGRIAEVGPTRRIENLTHAKGARTFDASGKVVMPAFIDSHAFLVPSNINRDVNGNRDHSASSAAGRAVDALPAGRLEAQARDLVKIMARHGSAAVRALSGYGFQPANELKILRAMRGVNRGPIEVLSVLNVLAPPPNVPDNAAGRYLAWSGGELLKNVARRKLASAACVRSGAYSLDAAAGFLDCARKAGLVAGVELQPGNDAGAVEMAVMLNALWIASAYPLALRDIERLANSITNVVLLPSVASRADSTRGARSLIDSGAAISIASGWNPETGGPASMQTAIQLAVDRYGFSPAQAITAATVNAAYAAGIGSRTGAIEHGRQADILIMNVGDYREIPFLGGANLVHSMFKDGVLLFEEDFVGWPDTA